MQSGGDGDGDTGGADGGSNSPLSPILDQDHPPPPQLPTRSGRHDEIKTTIAGVAGNMLEWYDFSVFGYLSDIIAKVFFPPNQSGNNALIESFAVFGIAFLIRPFGGLLLGHLGDTIGRKAALETSIFLMAFPTFALGCLPGYGTVGWVSILLLVGCRLLQGLSLGGQVMSSVVFTVESQEDKSKRGLHATFPFMASSLGVLFGSLVSYILRETLSDEDLEKWGWRLPFFVGILGAVPAIYLKHGVVETEPYPVEGVAGVNGEHGAQPAASVFREVFGLENLRALVTSALVPMLPSTANYIVYIWLATYMEVLVDPPIPHAFALNAVVVFLGGMVFAPLGGWIADLYGNKYRIMIISGMCAALCGPLLIGAIDRAAHPAISLLCQLSLALLLALYSGAMVPWLVEIFPPSIRLTSMSIGWNIAVSICGGMAPAMATFLVDRFGNASPGYLISAITVVSLFGLFIAPRPKDTHGDLGVILVAGDDPDIASASGEPVYIRMDDELAEDLHSSPDTTRKFNA